MDGNKKRNLIRFIDKRSIRLAVILCASLLFSFFLTLILPGIFTISENQVKDQLFRLRYKIKGKEKVSPYLIHVVFDDESLRYFDAPPWDREVYAKIIDVLKEAGAAFIAYDIFFQQKISGETNDELVDATAGAGNVYYPIILYEKPFSKIGPETVLFGDAVEKIEQNLWKPDTVKAGDPIKAGTIITPYEELFFASRGTGHINCTPDSDGINRRFPLVFRYGEGFIPALTLNMVCDYLKVKPGNIAIDFGRYLNLKNAVFQGNRKKDILIPIDEAGRAVINYVGPNNDSFYEISVKDLLSAQDDRILKMQLKDTLEKSLVLVSDVSVRNKDVGPGVYDNLVPSSEILITLANMILTDNFLYPQGAVHLLLALLLFSSALWILSGIFRLPGFFISSGMIMIGYIGYSITVFLAFGILPVILFPVIGFLFYMLFGSAYLYSYEKNKAEKYKKDAENHLEAAEREKEAKHRLEDKNALKNESIENLVHDLRGLLQTITSSFGSITDKAEAFDAKKQKADIKNAERNTLRILKYVNDLLETAKIESGMNRLKASEIDIAVLSESVKDSLSSQARAGGIELILKKRTDPAKLFCEEKKVESIFFNLLSNALKYTKRGGTVTITIFPPLVYDESIYPWKWEREKPGQFIRIEVSDTGRGISGKEKENLFRRFWGKDGTGIGLYIVDKYTEIHYGHVAVESKEGAGSTFTILLPCGSKHLLPEEIFEAQQPVYYEARGKEPAKDADSSNPESGKFRRNESDSNGSVYRKSEPVKRILTFKTEKNKKPVFPLVVVDDEESMLDTYHTMLQESGYNNYILCLDPQEVFPLMANEKLSVLILDLMMPGIGGMELLAGISKKYPEIPVIIATGRDRAEAAMSAVKHGAFDYIVKPVDGEKLTGCIDRALKKREQVERITLREVTDEREKLKNREVFKNIVGNSPGIIRVFHDVENYAASKKPILIIGETGVGKELVAEAVHRASGRSGKYVIVNTEGIDAPLFNDTLFGRKEKTITDAPLPRAGLVKTAEGGTLFLDEIGRLQMSSQEKLLRLIANNEYRPIGYDTVYKANVRIIAATNVSLEEKARHGEFLEDLYQRFSLKIYIPPLRERREDIKPLFEYFLGKTALESKKMHLLSQYPPEILVYLEDYPFKGNIRELENVIEEAVLNCTSDTLSLNDFKEIIEWKRRNREAFVFDGYGNRKTFIFKGCLEELLKKIEKHFIYEVLKRTRGNISTASRELGMDYDKLRRRIKKKDF